jgi:hypothetical protein
MRRWPLEVRIMAALTLIVALGAGALSWSALTAFAAGAHIAPAITWIYPVVVDGLMAVGTVAALVLRRAPLRTRAYVWAMIGASIAVSIAGNAAHASGAVLPPSAAALASAVPAAALAASLHLMVVMTRSIPHTSEGAPAIGRRVSPGVRAGARRREARVALPDGRVVSAGHARKLRAARLGELEVLTDAG